VTLIELGFEGTRRGGGEVSARCNGEAVGGVRGVVTLQIPRSDHGWTCGMPSVGSRVSAVHSGSRQHLILLRHGQTLAECPAAARSSCSLAKSRHSRWGRGRRRKIGYSFNLILYHCALWIPCFRMLTSATASLGLVPVAGRYHPPRKTWQWDQVGSGGSTLSTPDWSV
jgi:hypothetical protein